MATVQISFTDASNNEESFEVFRSDDAGTSTGIAAEKLATITWNSATTNWDYAQEVIDTAGSSDGALTTPVTTPPTTVGQQFILRYTEGTSGTYKYAVLAKNAIGPSALVQSAAITV